MRPEYTIAFNLTPEESKNMTFYQAYTYSDAIFSQRFEGIPQVIDWTPEQIEMINTTQIYYLLDPYTPKARKLFVSKLLESVMYEITDVVNSSKARNPSIPYYRLHSSHDTQVSNIMQQIDHAFNFTYIPYASGIYFEVYKHEGEFFVKTSFNGQPLTFGECADVMCPA